LIGGGGHCKSVLDSVLSSNLYSEIGIIEKNNNTVKSLLNVFIIGCDDDLFELYQRGYSYAFVTLGSTGTSEIRIKLFSMIEKIGFEIPNIIDPSAIISHHAILEKGIFIGKNVVINAGTYIGKGAIINTSSTIEHDCTIGEFSHIAPGTVLCGDVQIGKHSHIGAKSVVKQQIKIGVNTLIGMGSVVLKDVKDNVVAYGNPCNEVKSR